MSIIKLGSMRARAAASVAGKSKSTAEKIKLG
jgi:hypothetical protein